VTAAIAPVGSTTIPPAGGPLTYTVTLANPTGQPQTVDAWTAVSGPVNREPIVGPTSVTIPAGGTVSRTLTQQVPGVAPAGTYTYTLKVGAFPGNVVASDAFTFVKQPGAGRQPSGAAAEWTVSGWEEAAAEAPQAGAVGAGVGVSPNPFAGSTTVRFTLEEPSEVRLAVYDVLGREVAVLVDGPLEAGAHAAAFDGSGLPSGVYVYRLAAEGAVATGRMTLSR
jgi:hypothetical protein